MTEVKIAGDGNKSLAEKSEKKEKKKHHNKKKHHKHHKHESSSEEESEDEDSDEDDSKIQTETEGSTSKLDKAIAKATEKKKTAEEKEADEILKKT